MALNIQQAVDKFGGADEAYKNKLKGHIRNAMGYSNEMTRLKGAINAPVEMGDIEGLDPAALARRRSGKEAIQKQIRNLSNAQAIQLLNQLKQDPIIVKYISGAMSRQSVNLHLYKLIYIRSKVNNQKVRTENPKR